MAVSGASLSLSVAMAAGVLGQVVARHLRIPGIVLLLALGVALGPEGAGWVRPRALGTGLHSWVQFAVAVILFEGGMNLEISRLRSLQRSLRRLLLLGGLVTWLGAAAAAWLFLKWPPALCFLFGSLVVVTGPTVVAPLLRELRFKPGIRSMLEAEGVLIDPIGALLAAVVLQVALVPEAMTVGLEVASVALRIGVGTAAGAATGFALAFVLRSPRLVPRGLENILSLSAVVLLFHGAEAFLSHSGIVAVTVAGMVVGNVETRVDRDLREFKDQLTVLLIGFVFVLLAADVRLSDIEDLGPAAWLLVASLVVVVRPLAVAVATWGSDIDWRERVLAAVIAPRGIVAAAVASATASVLDKEGTGSGDALRALVFLTIIVTVGLAGLVAAPLGTLLGLRIGMRRAVAILGARGLGLLLAEQLRRSGRDVVFLDDDPRNGRRAGEVGFRVVTGDALRERSLLQARIEEVQIAVGLTSNDHLNTLFAATCCGQHRVPRGLVALAGSGTAAESDAVRRFHGAVLFDGPHDRLRWDLRWRNGQVETLRLPCLESPDFTSLHHGDATPESGSVLRRDLALVLGYERGGQGFEIMTRSSGLRADDVAVVAVHTPQRAEALAGLLEAGFGAPLETEQG
ncbi:MAG: cation:proton antiporter [Candidatus Binatia bacterium]